jgi:hypothetical protein
MFRIKAKNFDEGYFKFNQFLFDKCPHEFNRGNVTAHTFHDEVVFETADIEDLHLHKVNYTKNKWAQLVRVYLDPKELGAMCVRLLHYSRQPRCKRYVPCIAMKFKSRKNVSGACLLDMIVGYNEKFGWHAHVVSRASELTMRWYADLIFIHVLLREVGKVVGFTTSTCKVFWHMASTYQSITSMPWFLIMNGQESWLTDHIDQYRADNMEGLTSWQWATLKRFEKSYLAEGYESYRVQRRASEAYKILKGLEMEKNPVWTHELKLPEIDLNQEIELVEEEDEILKKGGAR